MRQPAGAITAEQMLAARLAAQELAEKETMMASERRNRMLEVQSCSPHILALQAAPSSLRKTPLPSICALRKNKQWLPGRITIITMSQRWAQDSCALLG